MPQKSSKKDHKCSRHTAIEGGSRWHKFHFSGKVIVCSCILGFMLVLVGGILFAIGEDQDEDAKPNEFEDVRKRPPMVYVGPVLMGIGVFIVVVGILMCLFETNVCRKRSPDASPLINAEAGLVEVKDSDGTASGYDPVKSSPRHKHKRNGGKKTSSSKKTKGSKKPHANSEKIPIAGTSAEKEPSRNFLTASDKFLTPPSSFRLEAPIGSENPSGKDSQERKAMLQSLTSSDKSWTTSAEFQTPTASFVDDPLTNYMENKQEIESSRENQKFLSPMQSNASILSDSSTYEGDDVLTPDINSKHEFLTPQNSHASILSDEPPKNVSPVQSIPNDHQIIQVEINVTEPTSVLPKETQEGASGFVEKSEMLIEKLNEEKLNNTPPEASEISAQKQEEESSSLEKSEILREKLNEGNLINFLPEAIETEAQIQEGASSSVEKSEILSEKLIEENLNNTLPEASEISAQKQEEESSSLETSEILREKLNEGNLINYLPEASETKAQIQGASSSVEKSEILSEKLNEENLNSPAETCEPSAVSSQSTDLLTNDSNESSEGVSKTIQDDSVGNSTKEVHDQKTDSTTEKKSTDLVELLE